MDGVTAVRIVKREVFRLMGKKVRRTSPRMYRTPVNNGITMDNPHKDDAFIPFFMSFFGIPGGCLGFLNRQHPSTVALKGISTLHK